MLQPNELATRELVTLRNGLRLMALHALHDRDAADDVVQESIARALEAIDAGRGPAPGKLGAFIAGIARHVIADIQRRARRVTPLDNEAAERAADNPDPLASLITTAERHALEGALRSLSAADRELLRILFVEGLDATELAVRLGEPPERIRKRKSRALGRLRNAFAACEAGSHDRARRTTDLRSAPAPPAASEQP